jgi:WD40 repeat protein
MQLQALLVSGGSDGLLVLWSADHGADSRELVPKLSLKAHDGGVVAVELSRVSGSAPQLITIGADKTLAIWDTMTFKELRRIKPVPKLACHSVASWCHPRAPNLDILTCVKDSHIWSIEHPTYSALTRPLCELSSLVPPQVLATHRKLRVISSLLMKSSKSTTYHIISFCLLVVYYINSSCSSLSMSIAL